MPNGVREVNTPMQFATYVAVGLLSAGIDVGAMVALIQIGLQAVPAASIAFVLGLLVNFALHSKVTFRVLVSRLTFVRYMTLVAFNYGITLGFVLISESLFGQAVVGKAVSLPVIAIGGFVIGRRWVFRPQESPV